MISKEDIESVNPSSLVSKTKGDRSIWLIVILLTLFSCLTVYSSTSALAYKYSKTPEDFLRNQIVFVIIGLGVMYFSHLIHYKYYSRIAVIMLFITIPLLLFTLVFGSHVNDASRWIKIPFIGLTFQTSDLAKLTIIMYTARQLSRKQEIIKDFRTAFIPILGPILVVFLLILPANLSTAAILLFTCIVLLFIGRINIKHLMLTGVVGIFVLISFVGIAKLVGYEGRIKTWESRIKTFNADKKSEVPFQTQQANIAIAKGGITGVGPGNSTQRNFLPHSDSDFIFAIIVEEYGLITSIILILLYLLFLFRCIKIFLRCPGAFGAFLAVGLGFALVIQALMHMSVNVHLTPVTGVTLPFISMGGTSLLFTSLATGIILSVSKHVEEEQQLLQQAELKKGEKTATETENSQESESPF
ncbi:MAG: hypothetical protein RJA07_2222 [Bacteroidota bacterium]|jgi:cell division protein FtsW